MRKLLGARRCWSAARSTSGIGATRAASASHLYFDDGSMVTLADDSPTRSRCSRSRARARDLLVDELGVRLREHALLEGDFLLRSGRRSSYYLDKYRFETRPELLGPLGERLAAAVARARAGRRPPRRPGARRGRARGLGVARVRAAVPDRPRGGEGVRHREPHRGGVRAGRARLPRRGRRHLRRRAGRGRARRCARPGSSSETRSASSTARRAARTRSPVSACACAAALPGRRPARRR